MLTQADIDECHRVRVNVSSLRRNRLWQAILMTYEGSGAEPAAAPRSLIVVLDWVGELKRLVPTQVHGLSGRSVPFEVLIQPLRKRSGSICPSLPGAASSSSSCTGDLAKPLFTDTTTTDEVACLRQFAAGGTSVEDFNAGCFGSDTTERLTRRLLHWAAMRKMILVIALTGLFASSLAAQPPQSRGHMKDGKT